MFCGSQPWVIISFAPGARGFQLGQLLLKHGLAHSDRNFSVNTICYNNNQPTHHTFGPTFGDILLKPLNDLQQQASLRAEVLMNSYDIHYESAAQELYQLLNTSAFVPDNMDLPNIILTHRSRLYGLRLLSRVCNNAKIIRITFDSVDQARATFDRQLLIKNKNLDQELKEQTLFDIYLPFLHNYSYCTNVPCTWLEQNKDTEILDLLK
jgi:hypothetical protein